MEYMFLLVSYLLKLSKFMASSVNFYKELLLVWFIRRYILSDLLFLDLAQNTWLRFD